MTVTDETDDEVVLEDDVELTPPRSLRRAHAPLLDIDDVDAYNARFMLARTFEDEDVMEIARPFSLLMAPMPQFDLALQNVLVRLFAAERDQAANRYDLASVREAAQFLKERIVDDVFAFDPRTHPLDIIRDGVRAVPTTWARSRPSSRRWSPRTRSTGSTASTRSPSTQA